ncbi:hypothetical protein [Nonomuraea sp. SBT364]|uniref:hypothetical protein n=1 Tax=Nonomuraea sp. SBT364 TaxID=1580530 RepID=UPI00069E4398|nr:hypothetical protein [Nonomuraea sp. SBT364]
MDDLRSLQEMRADAPEPGTERLARMRATVMEGATAQPYEPLTAGADGSARASLARRTPRRRLRRVGAALAGAAAAAVAAVTLYGTTAAPAFAVDKRADGTVEVWIKEFRDPGDLEAELAAAGVKAVVDYLPAGQTCKEPRGTHPAPGGRTETKIGRSRDGISFSITGGQVKDGQTLVLTAGVDRSDPGKPPTSLSLGVVAGEVAPCEPVSLPKPTGPALSGERGVRTGTGEGDGPALNRVTE